MHQHHVRTHQVEYLHPRLRLLIPRRDCQQIGSRRERGLAQDHRKSEMKLYLQYFNFDEWTFQLLSGTPCHVVNQVEKKF